MTKISGNSFIVLAAGAAAILALSSAAGQQRVAPDRNPDAKDELAQNFLAEHEIGRRFHIDPADLPAPKSGPIVTNRSLVVPYDGQGLQVPPGFVATPFATGLANPRRLLVLPNGDVLVAEQSAGYLTLLRDDGEGHAKWIDRHVEDLNRPYGLALRGDEILVADQDAIWRVPHMVGALRAGRPVPPQNAADVPPDQRKPVPGAYGAELLTKKGVFGIPVGHQNRHLAIDPKTGALYVGVGSSGNIGVEPEPKAMIQRFDADGSNQTTVASGTRNPTALAFHPQTGELWAVVQERDGLGDNLPSDYLIRVQQGGFYGWPYAYIGKHPQPGFANLAPDKVEATITPDLLFTAHSSLLDLVFYEGDQFPAEYKGSLFVALKGSWNRSVPTGYKIARVPFKDGRPEGWYENFATGFWASGNERAEVWGRPAALAVAKDGSLLVADDTGGTIWRISYKGPPAEHAAMPANTSSEGQRQ
ncbi:MAG: PQQ-dependent sugar dehydrogenase [Alphaproteobacteria bacterium]|nr:PQQ-dependent sugar dehydrogenase [Alphaproteobacteria bacterium]